MEYFRPSKNEHELISTYLESEFFAYLDSLAHNEFADDGEKEFLKKLIMAISRSFGKSQDSISDVLDEKDRSAVSRYTDRLNTILVKFCKNKISPPIQLFYHHLNSRGEKKRPQCHLACSDGKLISTVKGSARMYSCDIIPFEQAKLSDVSEQKGLQDDPFLKISLLLKRHQISEARNLLGELEPLDSRVIFYKQLAILVSKRIRKLNNQEAKLLCGNLELLLQTDLKQPAALILHAIREKYYDRLGRPFTIRLPRKPTVKNIKSTPESELAGLIIKSNS